MIKEINLSEEYLKAVTGKFDLETIFNLELPNKNISKLGAIPKCTSILFLDLSQNNLSSISGLEKLSNMMFLDLSFNNISNISPLQYLKELINVKLQGNNINGPPPSILANLKKLEKITFYALPFQDKPDVNTSNPICDIEDYREKMLECLPQINYLDGIPRGMNGFENETEESNDTFKDKLNVKNFDFTFDGKVKMDKEDILPKDEIDVIKRNIEDKYSEFNKALEEAKRQIDEIA